MRKGFGLSEALDQEQQDRPLADDEALEPSECGTEPLEAGDCAEYLRACVWALETIGPRANMPGLTVARAYVENDARQVATISTTGSGPESRGPWSRLNAALLARGHHSCIGYSEPATQAMPSTRTAVEVVAIRSGR